MFDTFKSKVLLVGLGVAGALVIPAAVVAATPTPTLPAGATQAIASADGVNPLTMTTARGFAGSITSNAAGGMTVTCTITSTVDYFPGGTARARNIVFSPAPCSTSVPGCTATIVASPAPNDTWGRRLIKWPGTSGAPSGTYDIVNVSLQNTFAGTCSPLPTGVPLTRTGLVWLRVAPVAGGPVTVAVPTAPHNVLTNPVTGASTMTGALSRSGPALYVL